MSMILFCMVLMGSLVRSRDADTERSDISVHGASRRNSNLTRQKQHPHAIGNMDKNVHGSPHFHVHVRVKIGKGL